MTGLLEGYVLISTVIATLPAVPFSYWSEPACLEAREQVVEFFKDNNNVPRTSSARKKIFCVKISVDEPRGMLEGIFTIK